MPLIRVYGNEELLLDEGMLNAICTIVADELECQARDGSEVRLDPDVDVDLFTHVTSSLDGMSRMTVDLLVDIEAGDCPDRVANRQERSDRIKARIRASLSGEKVGVWLKTVSASWSS